jgi:hypothetical protein
MPHKPPSCLLLALVCPFVVGLSGLWWGWPASPALSAREQPRPEAAPAPVKVAVYDADPQHLWNRLHAALFVRLTERRGDQETLLEPDNQEARAHELDPLLWDHSRYLLTGPGGKPALVVLDEFLAQGGEKLIKDPLRRALLQRDLWALFDWATSPGWMRHTEFKQEKKDPFKGPRKELATRLLRAVQRLALAPAQVAALPDNYAAALAARTLPAAHDPGHPKAAFLPPDLWQPQGPWVLLGDKEGPPLARTHVKFFGGRSTFLVFLRLPQGRDATLEYLGELRGWSRAGRRGDPPQFPPGTQVALVRQLLLIDDRGDIAPTRLTETVQVRIFWHVNKGIFEPHAPDEQRFEIKLRRQDLLAAKAGGLVAVKDEDHERDFLLFLGNNAGERGSPVLASCRHCHQGLGIQAVNSFTRFLDPRAAKPDLTASTHAAETAATAGWKREQFSWGLLHWLWEGQPGR